MEIITFGNVVSGILMALLGFFVWATKRYMDATSAAVCKIEKAVSDQVDELKALQLLYAQTLATKDELRETHKMIAGHLEELRGLDHRIVVLETLRRATHGPGDD